MTSEGNLPTAADILGGEYSPERVFAVTPLTDCPHLSEVATVPDVGLDTKLKCSTVGCNERSENWVCLSCYKVYCSRFVSGHMLDHNKEHSQHCVVLSYSDFSVWCYQCNDYIHNAVLHAAKSAAHRSKFGIDYDGDGL